MQRDGAEALCAGLFGAFLVRSCADETPRSVTCFLTYGIVDTWVYTAIWRAFSLPRRGSGLSEDVGQDAPAPLPVHVGGLIQSAVTTRGATGAGNNTWEALSSRVVGVGAIIATLGSDPAARAV
jgi:hypothetical protein